MSSDANIVYVLLAARDQSLPLAWFAFHKSAQVELVTVGPGRDAASQGTLAAILSRLAGLHAPSRIAASVIASEPRLVGLEDLVVAIVSQPWQVRDPADLARAAGCVESSVRERCKLIGLKRTEHFVTLIRWLAFQIMTGKERMSVPRARRLLGISDPSNFRRQLSRARYFSHP